MTTRLFEELKDYDIDLREAVIPAMSSRFRRANLLVSITYGYITWGFSVYGGRKPYEHAAGKKTATLFCSPGRVLLFLVQCTVKVQMFAIVDVAMLPANLLLLLLLLLCAAA